MLFDCIYLMIDWVFLQNCMQFCNIPCFDRYSYKKIMMFVLLIEDSFDSSMTFLSYFGDSINSEHWAPHCFHLTP